jgi:hypothetical protein
MELRGNLSLRYCAKERRKQLGWVDFCKRWAAKGLEANDEGRMMKYE